MKLRLILLLSSLTMISACSGTKPVGSQIFQPSDRHIQAKDVASSLGNGDIPQASKHTIPLEPPKPSIKVETYSVVVTNVPAQEILFALARDAKINLDITPGVQGNVTINAINQTLPQILNRISKQVDMRYEFDNGNLIVMPDSPYLKTYKVDYVNMTRDSDGGISNSIQVGGGGGAGSSGGTTAGNSSKLSIVSSSKNHFWERLESNIKDILRETDKILPDGSSETSVQRSSSSSTTGTGVQPSGNSKKQVAAKGGIENSPNAASIEDEGTTVTSRNTFREAASVISNPENGIITVRATSKQHDKIQEFISNVMTNSHRQVLIEATIVEVNLNKAYQQGIDWRSVRTGNTGFQVNQLGTTSNQLPSLAGTAGNILTLDYKNPNSSIGALSAAVQLMDSFGTVKVLSSPKLSVMNNQTAMLRVVDNYVYFTIQSNTTTNQTSSQTTYTSTPNSVPVGFTMSVTPQINDNSSVLLNLRPSITRLFGYVNDPNPSLSNPCAGVANCTTPAIVSKIPQTQTREMESILRIENNQIAVMGGLMQDEIDNYSDEIPFLGRIPFLGNLFKNRNDSNKKSELVIFIRPIVIKESGIEGDYSEFRNNLPASDFLEDKSRKVEPQEKQKL